MASKLSAARAQDLADVDALRQSHRSKIQETERHQHPAPSVVSAYNESPTLEEFRGTGRGEWLKSRERQTQESSGEPADPSAERDQYAEPKDLPGRSDKGLDDEGDRLVEGLGLTSARWQVLGAIAYADRAQPVAWLARDMGANRQNVQRIINDLNEAGLVAFESNPHHRRAQLVTLTAKGKQTFESAMRLQRPWVNGLAQGLTAKDIETAHRVLSALRRRLDGKDAA